MLYGLPVVGIAGVLPEAVTPRSDRASARSSDGGGGEDVEGPARGGQ